MLTSLLILLFLEGCVHVSLDAIDDSGMGECNQEETSLNIDESQANGTSVKQVIVLAGQSNAAGYSDAQFLPDSAGHISSARVTAMRAGFDRVPIMYCNNPFDTPHPKTENKQFEPTTLGFGFLEGTHFGPEVGIAEYLSEHYSGETFYIIKCATGGSSLEVDWDPSNTSDTALYSHMIRYVQDGIHQLERDGSTVEIVAFCWLQGESDSRVASYARLFDSLIKGFEDSFSSYLPPRGMAVIQAGISKFWDNHRAMNIVKKKYAEEHECAYYFDTTDLSYDRDNQDYAHYDAASMIIIGNRFAEAIAFHLERRT
jgi:hypothetical protein